MKILVAEGCMKLVTWSVRVICLGVVYTIKQICGFQSKTIYLAANKTKKKWHTGLRRTD